MKVLSAIYGNKDVTDIATHYIDNIDKRSIYVSNSIFGDPSAGTLKTLVLRLEDNGITRVYEAKENSVLNLPIMHSKREKLGIFYSNNNTSIIYPCILKSLDTVKNCSNNVADIVTNFWNSFEEKNPCIETLSWFKVPSHLNQILQILQCLYVAKRINDYRYVSFLEHDVLYPDGYFDYPDFDGNIICNTNYIGLGKNGFQKLKQHDKPLSQITMKFTYAIDYFVSLLPNALILNSGNIDKFDTIVSDWQCRNPCVHVNHGLHFTSHYKVYSQTDITEYNDYWGDYKKYEDLLI